MNGGSQSPAKRRSGGHGPTLADEVEHDILLPTPVARDAKGTYSHPAQEWQLTAARGDGGRSNLPDVAQFIGSLLPTPMAGDAKGARNKTANRNRIPPTGVHGGETLHDVLLPRLREEPDDAMLPTPDASAGTGGRVSKDMSKTRPSGAKKYIPLSDVAHHELRGALLPTPQAADGTGGHRSRGGARSDEPFLQGIAEAAMLPTPRAADGMNETMQTTQERLQRGARHRGTLEEAASSFLPTPRATRGGSSTETVYLLPTPVADYSENTPEQHLAKKPGRNVVTDLKILAENDLIATGGVPIDRVVEKAIGLLDDDALLPTPNATDYKGSNRSTSRMRGGRRRTAGDADLPEAVEELLPTPTSQAARHGAASADRGEHDDANLWTVADRLLPTPRAIDGRGKSNGPRPDTITGLVQYDAEHQRRALEPGQLVDWGKYARRVQFWEQVQQRFAPAPLEPGRTGDRLAPRFVEWMMGLVPGWVTGVPGLSRNAQLRILGNGVVPQQALLGLRMIAGRLRYLGE